MSGRRGIAVLLLVAVAVLALLALKNAHRKFGADFVVLHQAAVAAVGGGDIYQAPPDMPARRYRYAPGTAFLLAPLAPLDYPAARRVWRWVITLALLGVVGWLAARRDLAVRPWAVPLAFLLGVRWWVDELHLGQINAIALLLVLLAFTLEDRGRPGLAGALLALPVALKVAPLVVAVDWLVRRRWRPLLGLALGGLALVALPALWFGAEGALRLHLRWLLSEGESTDVMIRHVGNQSFWAMAALAGAPRWVAALASAALVAIALRPADVEARRALLLAATPLVSSYGWIQNFVFMLPLVAWVLRSGGRAPVVATIAFGLVAPIVQYEVVGPAREHWLVEHEVIGLAGLGLFLVGAWATRGAARPDEQRAAAAAT
jgi:hypothetical protein